MNLRELREGVDHCHKKWLGEILKLNSQKDGIDLADDDVGVELKARWIKWYRNFACADYQRTDFKRDNPGKELYWAFLLYDFKQPPEKREGIESLLERKEVFFFNWKWIDQFPVRPCKFYSYRYVHSFDFPPKSGFHKFTGEGAKLYVPKNSVLEVRLLAGHSYERV